MKEFMFFIHKKSNSEESLTPFKHTQFLQACEKYIGELKQKGALLSAQPISWTGTIIAGKEGRWIEAPFYEPVEVIGGYYHIRAKDLDEAIAIAKANPEFQYNENTRIEVRPIKTREETTGFTYPGKT